MYLNTINIFNISIHFNHVIIIYYLNTINVLSAQLYQHTDSRILRIYFN